MSWNLIKFSQKIVFGTKSKFSKFFVHVSCRIVDTEVSNFDNLYKFEQKINFWIFGAFSYFQGSAVQQSPKFLTSNWSPLSAELLLGTTQPLNYLRTMAEKGTKLGFKEAEK